MGLLFMSDSVRAWTGLLAVVAFAVAGPNTITSTFHPGANGNPVISGRWWDLIRTNFLIVRKNVAVCFALYLTFRLCT